MIETFKLKGVEITVNYNEIAFNHNDILKILKNGIKSLNKFYAMENLFDITNKAEIIRELFFSDNLIIKTVDLTNYVYFCKCLGKSLKEMLYNTFKITIENKVKDETYTLKGSKESFSLLKDFL